MKVDTYLFGAVEVDPEKVITFPDGLVGFENSKRYILAHEVDNGQPTSFTLQSLDEAGLAFQIVDPTTLGFSYQLSLTDAENSLLQSPGEGDAIVMQILYKNDAGGNAAITPNLRAPLVINTKARLGIQKVMETMYSNITLSNLSSAV